MTSRRRRSGAWDADPTIDAAYHAGQRTHTTMLWAGVLSLAALAALFAEELTRSPDPTYLTAIALPAIALAVLLARAARRARHRRR